MSGYRDDVEPVPAQPWHTSRVRADARAQERERGFGRERLSARLRDGGVVLQCCLNGARPAEASPAIPTGARELARDARAVAALGVTSVHVHPRGPSGHETLEAGSVGSVVGAIRRAAPGIEVAVPAARWVEPDSFARTELVQRWAQLPACDRPDVAAVNVHDRGWQAVCAAAESVGIGVELGVWTTGDAVSLRREGPPPGVVRVVVEVTVTDPGSAVAEAVRLIRTLGPVAAPVLLHGEEDGAWPVLDYARRKNLDARIGFEDTLTGPDGRTTATSNIELVRDALTPSLAARLAAPHRSRRSTTVAAAASPTIRPRRRRHRR